VSAALARIAEPLCIQMMDLRSSVAKESVTVVAQLASQYPEEFAESGHKYFRDLPNDGLIKLLNKA